MPYSFDASRLTRPRVVPLLSTMAVAIMMLWLLTSSSPITTSAASGGGVIGDTETRLADLFPRASNGDNGIFLQYRATDGSYVDLTYIGDYGFATPSAPSNIPYIWVTDRTTGLIDTHPSVGIVAKRDPLIRVTLNGSLGEVRVTGVAGHHTEGAACNATMRFYIYKGPSNYSQPIWDVWNGGSFDLIIPYADGEQLFFAVDGGPDDCADWAYWQDIRFRGMPALPSGLVSFWPGDGNTNDLVSGNHGSWVRSAAYGQGIAGQSFDLRQGGSVSFPDSANLRPPAFTVAFWLYLTQAPAPGTEYILVNKYGGLWDGWIFRLGYAKLSGWAEAAPVVGLSIHRASESTTIHFSASEPVALNKWVHIAGSYDGTIATIYVDGVASGSLSLPGGYLPSTGPLLIGNAAWCACPSAQSQGLIDEVQLYNRALTPSDIGAIISESAADLMIESIGDPPPSVNAGGTVAVSDWTRNYGLGSATASTTRYYLSLDQQWSADDILLSGGRSVPALDPATSSSGTVTVTVPTEIPPMTFYLLACADDLKVVVESNESNNCRSSLGQTIVLGWSLASDFRVAPSQANPNPDNMGNPNVWHFMASDSLVHDPATYRTLPEFVPDALSIPGLQQWQGTVDIGVGGRNKLPAIGINASGSPQSSGIPNFSWPPGVVRVHPLAGQLGVVGWQSPIQGLLRIVGSVADLEYCNGGNGISWSIDRGGTILASGSIPEGSMQQFQNGLNGTNLSSVSVNRGEFLYFIVDAIDGQYGCDSTALDVTITPASQSPTLAPDLMIESIGDPPTTAGVGSTFSVTDWTRNYGLGAAGASTTRYYLSLDQQWGTDDILLLGERSVPPNPTSSSGSTSVTVPSTTPPGTYYLIACADEQKVVTENNETNNCRSSAGQVAVTSMVNLVVSVKVHDPGNRYGTTLLESSNDLKTPADRPLRNATVSLIDDSGSTTATTLSNDSGQATFEAISPGQYSVRAELRNDDFEVRYGLGATAPVAIGQKPVTLTSQAVQQVTLDLSDLADPNLTTNIYPIDHLDDLAIIYYHTRQVMEFETEQLGIDRKQLVSRLYPGSDQPLFDPDHRTLKVIAFDPSELAKKKVAYYLPGGAHEIHLSEQISVIVSWSR